MLRVPAEYPSIQAAFEATSPRDTVLVGPGSYHEFLVGPSHSYMLFGEYPLDSFGREFWAVVDPIPLPDADTPSTFIANGDTVVVKNIAFYNRPEIRQEDFARRTGGIRNQADLLIVEDCRFDSVSDAIRRGMDIRVSRTVFQGCNLACAWTALGGRLIVRECSFNGSSGNSYIMAYDGSVIESCTFGCNPTGHFVSLFGSAIRVSACQFGPCEGNLSTLFVRPVDDVIVERCDFSAIEGVSIILEVDMTCIETDFPPIIVRDNTFQNFRVSNYALKFWCEDGTGNVGLIQRNSFINGEGGTIPGVCVNVSGSATLLDNHLGNSVPNSTADIYTHPIESVGSLVARDNRFLPPGLAAATLSPPFDARWNWWGDSTGPYNSLTNPNGMGAEVGNGVIFDPWLTMNPDSVDTTGTATRPKYLPPAFVQVYAYPNPFNSSVTILLEVEHAGIYDLRLFDLTGREVSLIFHGAIQSQTQVQYTNPELASGVYFVQLRRSETVVAATKVLLLK